MNNKGIGICEWSLPIPLRGPLCGKVVKDFGLDAVELELGVAEENFPLANPYVIEQYKEGREASGVVYTGIAVNCTDFYPMNAPLGDPGREYVEFALRQAIDAAHALDIPLIHVPSLHGLMSEVKTEEDLKNTSECLQRSCDYAADKGVIVCTENDFPTDMQLRQIEMVDRDNFKIYFDTQNYHALNGLHTPDLIAPIFDHIAEFHIKDGFDQISTHLIGEGDCDAFASLEEFNRLGYTGWVMLENYFFRTPMCRQGDDPFALMQKDIDTVKEWLRTH